MFIKQGYVLGPICGIYIYKAEQVHKVSYLLELGHR